MSKLTFEMPDMDVTLLAAITDVIVSSSVETGPGNPNRGDWIPAPGKQ